MGGSSGEIEAKESRKETAERVARHHAAHIVRIRNLSNVLGCFDFCFFFFILLRVVVVRCEAVACGASRQNRMLAWSPRKRVIIGTSVINRRYINRVYGDIWETFPGFTTLASGWGWG